MLNLRSLLQESGKGVRTQITLTPLLKKAIEAKSRLTGESLSAYLRQAAVIRIAAEEVEKDELKVLAQTVIGSVKKESHPEWQTKTKIDSWVKKIRQEWR